MRKILFKAKQINNGEWVQGFYAVNSIGIHIIITNDPFVIYDIDPATICQYTGLTDKNGVKIFDGDIINCSQGCSHEIIWLEEYAGAFFGGMPAVYLSGMNQGYAWTGEEEFIGSIHDKKEKLKQLRKERKDKEANNGRD